MGNYLFKPEVLVALLERTARLGGTDFGKDVLPALPDSGLRAIAYDFAGNRIPGIQTYEELAYWRDVGTLAALAQAQQDVEGTRPRFDLRNRAWPIRRDLLAGLGRLHALPAYESGRYAA
jgi:glucose-1-phosphate adenylyltransferase